jgi:hypothetical protein
VTSKTTVTYPRDERGYQLWADLITAIRVYGAGIELALLAALSSFTFGRDELCDLRVDSKFVARMQARIDRIPTSLRQSLRVTDISSGKNDIVPNGEVAEREFVMGAGEWFDIGKARFFAMNEEMRTVRSQLMDVLGIGQHEAIDDLLITAVKDSSRHVLLTGEQGCDQARLGHAIHQVSHRRHKGFLDIGESIKLDSELRQKLLDARGGTLLVTLFHKGMLDQRLVQAMVEPEADLRLIICALSPGKIAASVPAETLQHAKLIKIPPLRERSAEIPQLFDKWFVNRRSTLRFAALRPELQQKIAAYLWPANLQEARGDADRLVTLSYYPTRYQAIKDSGITDSTLRRWEKRLGTAIKFPITAPKANK